MKNKYNYLIIFIVCLISISSTAQQKTPTTKHSYGYIWPTDQKVLNKLNQWKDLKLGVIFHWGIYSINGILESWGLCNEDIEWIKEQRPQDMTYEEYKKWYWEQNKFFNPTQFNPDEWADLMKRGGMKYIVFTTKHHDGFCMFDTKETDFSIMNTPYGKNPKANVTKYIFDAFRKKDFMIGAYFSKPDWHNNYYWHPDFPTPDRNVNYDTKKYPMYWNNFCDYTYKQIKELTNGEYGDIDILWLDGGWVSSFHLEQDIHMDKIAAMARESQPGIIIVDRAVPGKFENYLTPEESVISKQLDIPWETCLPINYWGYRKDNKFKSAKNLIATLIEVVSKGGNLLLGVGPTPQGTIDETTTDRIDAIGKWMNKFGKGIYNTVNAQHYNDGNVWFTADKDGETLYAFYALKDTKKEVPSIIEWNVNIPFKKKVTLLSTGKTMYCQVKDNKVKIKLPKDINRSESIGFSFKIGYTVSNDLNNLFIKGNINELKKGDNYTATLVPKKNFALPQKIAVRMGKRILVDKKDYTYNPLTGKLVIPNVTDNIIILASGTPIVANQPVEKGEEVKFHTHGNHIEISTSKMTKILLFDMMGRCVYSKKIDTDTSIQLTNGNYILVIGEKSYKIILR